ncbi:MAG: dockerin type I domain-containing protein, partial [Pirellulaceae bacterium]
NPITGPFYDVNGNGVVQPLDALVILNYLNKQAFSVGEAEQQSDPLLAAPIVASGTLITEQDGEVVEERPEDHAVLSMSQQSQSITSAFALELDLDAIAFDGSGDDEEDDEETSSVDQFFSEFGL